MNKINTPIKLASALREILYELTLKKPTLADKYAMLRRYDSRIDITDEGDPWNVVDLTQCKPEVINESRIKAQRWLERLS